MEERRGSGVNWGRERDDDREKKDGKRVKVTEKKVVKRKERERDTERKRRREGKSIFTFSGFSLFHCFRSCRFCSPHTSVTIGRPRQGPVTEVGVEEAQTRCCVQTTAPFNLEWSRSNYLIDITRLDVRLHFYHLLYKFRRFFVTMSTTPQWVSTVVDQAARCFLLKIVETIIDTVKFNFAVS